jgi:hypothetical protein
LPKELNQRRSPGGLGIPALIALYCQVVIETTSSGRVRGKKAKTLLVRETSLSTEKRFSRITWPYFLFFCSVLKPNHILIHCFKCKILRESNIGIKN